MYNRNFSAGTGKSRNTTTSLKHVKGMNSTKTSLKGSTRPNTACKSITDIMQKADRKLDKLYNDSHIKDLLYSSKRDGNSTDFGRYSTVSFNDCKKLANEHQVDGLQVKNYTYDDEKLKRMEFYQHPKYIEIIEAIEAYNYSNKKSLVSGNKPVDPYENMVLTKLNLLVEEMHRIYDINKMETCLDSIYLYYITKLKKYQINKNTKRSSANLARQQQEERDHVDTTVEMPEKEKYEDEDEMIAEFKRVNNFMPQDYMSLSTTRQNFFSTTQLHFGEGIDTGMSRDDLALNEDLKKSLANAQSGMFERTGQTLQDYDWTKKSISGMPPRDLQSREGYKSTTGLPPRDLQSREFNMSQQQLMKQPTEQEQEDEHRDMLKSRMQSRLELRKMRDREDEQFQSEIKRELSEWNMVRNRAEEDQVKRYEDLRHNTFLKSLSRDPSRELYSREGARRRMDSREKSRERNEPVPTLLKDPHEQTNDDDDKMSMKSQSKTLLSEKIRQMRINNAKVLNLTEDQVNMLKGVGDIEMSRPLLETRNVEDSAKILLSYSHPKLELTKSRKKLDPESDFSRPNTAMAKTYSMNEYKEWARDSRYRAREEVDHMKRTFAGKDLRISGDVVYKALMVPDLDAFAGEPLRPPNMNYKLFKIKKPGKK